MAKTLLFCNIVLFLAVDAALATNNEPTGPCREWIRNNCRSGEWVCTSIEDYMRYQHGFQLGCPIQNLEPPTPPPGQCRLMNGSCQYTQPTVACDTWVPDCDYRYTCGTVAERNRTTDTGALCGFGGFGANAPDPDVFCEPVNGSCQWYNPCRYWRGHCLSAYQCGTVEQYYQFQSGPHPLCALPPEGWTEPLPPGECVLTGEDQQCGWSDCVAYLDWCRTTWTCGTQYDHSVYLSSPPPPCPAPPPNYTPPPQPGVCRFNVTANRGCHFQERGEIMTTATPTATPTANCHSLCGNGCPTCSNRNFPTGCAETCSEGCECPPGTVIDDFNPSGDCVPHDQCSIHDDACFLGVVTCPPHHNCLPWGQHPQGAVCIRLCSSDNGGCGEDQVCLEEPYCTDCNLKAVMNGRCENLDTDAVQALPVSVVVGMSVGIVLGVFAVLVVVTLIIVVLVVKIKWQKNERNYEKDDNIVVKADPNDYKYAELKRNDSVSAESSSLEKEDLSNTDKKEELVNP